MKTVDSLFRKRQREGSGSVFLRRKAATMNPATQSLLAELLEWSPTTKQDETDNHDADKDDTDKCKNEPTEDTAPLFSTERFFLHGWNPKDDGKQIVDVSGTDDEEVLLQNSLLALLDRVLVAPDGHGREDSDDRHHDQQLDQREAGLTGLSSHFLHRPLSYHSAYGIPLSPFLSLLE